MALECDVTVQEFYFTHFTGESTEAMQIKCLAQGHNILMVGFKLSTSVSINRHSNHMSNIQSDYGHSYRV